MALQLSNLTKNKGLNNVFRPVTSLYVMIPTVDGAGENIDLPREEIVFNVANNGQISLAAPVQLVVEAGTTIDMVYLHQGPLINAIKDNALVRIELTGDDVEVYDNNGIYIINTINVAINT